VTRGSPDVAVSSVVVDYGVGRSLAVPPLLAAVLANSIALQVGGPQAAALHPAPVLPTRGGCNSPRPRLTTSPARACGDRPSRTQRQSAPFKQRYRRGASHSQLARDLNRRSDELAISLWTRPGSS